MITLKPYIFIIALMLGAMVANAQTDEKRTTKLNFEDELIRGDVSSPDLLLILRNKNPDYGRLLKLRENFLPELRETRYEVMRGMDE